MLVAHVSHTCYASMLRDDAFTSAELGRQDSNLRMSESKSEALPLGDAPMRTTLEKIAVWLSMALLCVMVGACRPGAATPEDALKTFLGDVQSRRSSEAWAGLSASSQEALLADARKLAAATGEPAETDPGKLLFERGELLILRKAESISVASRPGDVAMLRVAVEGGASANVRMVRDGASWKVDLVSSLEPRAALPAVIPQAPPRTETTTQTGAAAEE